MILVIVKLFYEDYLYLIEFRWFVVYMGYKWEKKVVSFLEKKGIIVYVFF